MPAGLTSILGADANGNALQILSGSDGSHNSPGHTLFDVNGVLIGTNSNPIFVTDPATEVAAGGISDAAYSGSGSGSIIALLKGLYAKIAGTLTVSGTVSVNALPVGSNTIGNVGVTSLPALPTGSNGIGSVVVSSLPALPAGSNGIGNVGVTSLPAIPAGSNAIGSVQVSSLPATPAGTNLIGAANLYVDGASAGNQSVPLFTRGLTTTLISRSVSSTVSGASTALVGANTTRRSLRIQAPQTAGIWINPLGGTCAPNAVDCLYIPPVGLYESTDGNAVTYYCATGSLVIAAFES